MDDGGTLQARPVVPFLQLFDVMDDGAFPGFDAAMVAIDRLVFADRGVFERAGDLLVDEQFNVVAQRALSS